MAEPATVTEPAVPDASAGPLVSVLVPCWNASGTIRRAIESVLAETDVSLECVVVDDGSTDGTADLVASLAADEPRLVLVRSPANEGVSAARNRGLGVVRGTWVTFLDADDRLLPGGLTAMARAAIDTDPLVVVAQRVWTDGQRTWVSRFYDIPDVTEAGRKSVATHPGLLYYASSTGKLFHRSLLDGLAFEGRVLGDQPWSIRAMLRAGDRIEVIGDVAYEWSRPPEGETGTSITSLSRASASHGAAAARVARAAYPVVVAEARRLLGPVAAEVVAAAYLDRLVRSDLGGYLHLSLERRDPALPELLDAIGAFLASLPRDRLAASTTVPRVLLAPPLRTWPQLSRRGHTAYWAMARPAVDANPRVGASLATSRANRAAFRALGALGSPLGTTLATSLVTVGCWGRAARRGRGGRAPA